MTFRAGTGGVRQPSYRPTNKLTAGTIGVAIGGVAQVFIQQYAPEYLADPLIYTAINMGFCAGLGYLVTDRPNQ